MKGTLLMPKLISKISKKVFLLCVLALFSFSMALPINAKTYVIEQDDESSQLAMLHNQAEQNNQIDNYLLGYTDQLAYELMMHESNEQQRYEDLYERAYNYNGCGSASRIHCYSGDRGCYYHDECYKDNNEDDDCNDNCDNDCNYDECDNDNDDECNDDNDCHDHNYYEDGCDNQHGSRCGFWDDYWNNEYEDEEDYHPVYSPNECWGAPNYEEYLQCRNNNLPHYRTEQTPPAGYFSHDSAIDYGQDAYKSWADACAEEMQTGYYSDWCWKRRWWITGTVN